MFLLFFQFLIFLYTGQLQCTWCLAVPSQTVVSCILYALHLYSELPGKYSEVKIRVPSTVFAGTWKNYFLVLLAYTAH